MTALFAVLVNMFVTQRSEALTAVGFILLGWAIYGIFLRHTGNAANSPANDGPIP